MPSLNDLLQDETDLVDADVEWLHLVVGDWQLLSDLSFADLVLWVPTRDDLAWVAVAMCRPSTGPTVHYDDIVGQRTARGRRLQLDRAYDLARVCRERDPQWYDDVPVREETIPVVRAGRVVAVVARHTNLAAARTPSRLELTYLQCADDLARMMAVGDYPVLGAGTGSRRGAPRVGDGLLRLDRDGVVAYASPNAVSALHRLGYLGDVLNRSLSEIVAPLLDGGGPVDESLPLVLAGRAPWRSELDGRGTTLSLRAIPLRSAGARVGAIVLLRDVTEVRGQERELLTKDATIREVHHRVKNNLQTVAALLRLQARRIPSAEGRIALQEAMRRVATIALVHEALSEGLGEIVDFDQVVDRTLALATELASAGGPVHVRREGQFGEMRAGHASPLALVLAELVTNAVEHGLGERGGVVTLRAERDGESLRALVTDDGVGLPDGFTPGGRGLGTQIVRELVGGEMRGRIEWRTPPEGGTQALVEVTLPGSSGVPAASGTPDAAVPGSSRTGSRG